ncbi:MAG: phosphoadenosine phosphosulfate reductase family protein [Bacillota bacterium]
MLRQVGGGKVPVRVIKIDTGADFPEIYAFVDRLFTAIRWDEQEARQDEQYFSEGKDPDHLRVQPTLHFKEIDIWSYIRKYELPFCELYRAATAALTARPAPAAAAPASVAPAPGIKRPPCSACGRWAISNKCEIGYNIYRSKFL